MPDRNIGMNAGRGTTHQKPISGVLLLFCLIPVSPEGDCNPPPPPRQLHSGFRETE